MTSLLPFNGSSGASDLLRQDDSLVSTKSPKCCIPCIKQYGNLDGGNGWSE